MTTNLLNPEKQKCADCPHDKCKCHESVNGCLDHKCKCNKLNVGTLIEATKTKINEVGENNNGRKIVKVGVRMKSLLKEGENEISGEEFFRRAREYGELAGEDAYFALFSHSEMSKKYDGLCLVFDYPWEPKYPWDQNDESVPPRDIHILLGGDYWNSQPKSYGSGKYGENCRAVYKSKYLTMEELIDATNKALDNVSKTKN